MRHQAVLLYGIATALLALSAAAGESTKDQVLPIPNGGFEGGTKHWTFYEGRGDCLVTDEQAATGKHALQIIGDVARKGAKVTGPRVACKGPALIELRGKVKGVSGRHLGLYIHEFDKAGKLLPKPSWGELGGNGGKWGPLVRQINLNAKTTHIRVFLLGYPAKGETIEVYLDDLHFVRLGMRIPPWPSQYKLKPTDKDKLTAADVVGPDGIVYPNWKQVGVQGGIPNVKVAVKLADLGAKPGTDIADLLDRACKQAGKKGGGVLIGAGTYFLSHPITITHSGVVIRGMGKDKTKLIYNYAVGQPGTDVGIYWPKAGEPVGPDTVVEAHVYHVGLKSFKMFLNDKEVAIASTNPYAQDRQVLGKDLLRLSGKGEAILRVEARYMDGHTAKAQRRITLTDRPQPVKGNASMRTLLFFKGAGLEEREYKLAADGKRGDTVLVFADAGDLKVGDKLELHAPGTKRWQTIIQHTAGGDDWKRIGFFEIKAKDGNRATINQPLRIDYPKIDGTYARRLRMIERVGIEDLTIEHKSRLPINSIEFDWAWNGWVRNVKVLNSGSSGAHGYRSKWLEFRDCEFDGAWNFDGGQAYSGFTSCHDSLYENNAVKGYRHAPVVQYGSMGNVFRNSTFDGSDLQWHAGWSTENLFENCVVKSYRGTGSYGYGAFATGSADIGHGPNGPRNVVYNCDISSVKAGVRLDGVNENWIFVHNRFLVNGGPGFTAVRGSFDHIIKGNVFILKDDKSPMLNLRTADCVGVELSDNVLHGGNGKTYQGKPKLTVNRNNKARPAVAGKLPGRPRPPVVSICEWQQKQATTGTK